MGGALVHVLHAVDSREPRLGVGVLLPVAVAQRELGEEGVVDGSDLEHVLGPFGGADEGGPAVEVRGIGANLVP